MCKIKDALCLSCRRKITAVNQQISIWQRIESLMLFVSVRDAYYSHDADQWLGTTTIRSVSIHKSFSCRTVENILGLSTRIECICV